MYFIGLSILLISPFLFQEYCAQDYSIGPLPANYYEPKRCLEPIDESAQPFLVTCAHFLFEGCAKNMSSPLMYWLRCIKQKREVISLTSRECTTFFQYPECNKTLNDPGTIIYAPLYNPNEKYRVYPEIFDQIRNISKSFAKAYVNTMKKTFSSGFANHYMYRWKNKTG